MRKLNEVDVQVGKALARLRAERGLTAAQMAMLAGVDETSLAAMETGERRAPARMLIALCVHFQLAAAYFYEGVVRRPRGRPLLMLV